MGIKKNIAILLLTLPMTAIAGDIDEGEGFYRNYGCMGCHGSAGIAENDPSVPNLAGQNEIYVINQLKAFASGERKNDAMENMSRMIEGKEADIAAYLYNIE